MSKAAEYRDMALDKLQMKVAEAEKRLTKLTIEETTDPSDDTSKKRNLKRDIARMKTVINEERGDS